MSRLCGTSQFWTLELARIAAAHPGFEVHGGSASPGAIDSAGGDELKREDATSGCAPALGSPDFQHRTEGSLRPGAQR